MFWFAKAVWLITIPESSIRASKKNTSYGNEVLSQDTTHITNEEVRAKIQQTIGPHEDLLIIVKRRKLQWYGHVSRSSGLAKTILQKGEEDKAGRRRGGKTTSGNGQVLSLRNSRGQRIVAKEKKEETGCEVICDALTTLAVKG